MESKEKVSVAARIGYSCDSAAATALYTIVMSFLLLFYTGYLGMPAAACGGVILVSKFLDGISDLIAGNIIDHTHKKTGSARPWILRLAIPVLISYIILFTVPPVSNVGKLVYLFVTYNVVNTVVYTMLQTSMLALPNFMTKDNQQRSTLYVLQMLISAIVQCLVGFFFMQMIIALGNDQRAWIIAGCILGTISMIFVFVCYYTCHEKEEMVKEKKEDIPFWKALKIVVTNKYWMLVLGVQLMMVLMQVCVLTVGTYYAMYVLNDVGLSGRIIGIFCLPGIPIVAILPKLIEKYGKRNVSLAGAVIMLISTIVLFVHSTTTMVYVSLIIRSFGFGMCMATMNGMLADSIEWAEYRSGLRPQSMTMAAGTVANKVGSGVGTALLGAYLSFCGYDADPYCASSVTAISNCFVIVPMVIVAILVILYVVYDLDKKYDGIVMEIANRKSKGV